LAGGFLGVWGLVARRSLAAWPSVPLAPSCPTYLDPGGGVIRGVYPTMVALERPPVHVLLGTPWLYMREAGRVGRHCLVGSLPLPRYVTYLL